jgi:hypothetical protein
MMPKTKLQSNRYLDFMTDFTIDITLYTIFAVVIFLVILGIYAYINKSNKSRMKNLFGAGEKISDENIVTHFLKNAVESYLELILSIPDFDFDTPVYYDDLGNISLIQSGGEPKGTGEPNVTEETKEEHDEDTELTSISDMQTIVFKDLSKDPEFTKLSHTIKNAGIAIAAQIVAAKALSLGAKQTGKFLAKRGFSKSITSISKFIGKKITIKTIAKIGAKSVSIPIKYASKGVMAIIAKLGSRVGFKTGIIAAKTLASKALTKAAAKAVVRTSETVATRTIARVGTEAASFASKAIAKAGMGPIGWALMAFDVLSIGLDLGDAGGYLLLDQYQMIRDTVNKELQDKFKEVGLIYPYSVGPMDKYREKAQEEYMNYMWVEKINIVQKNIAYYERLLGGVLFDSYSTAEEKQADIILKLSDKDALELEGNAVRLMCKKLDGDVYKGMCMFNDYFDKTQRDKIYELMSPDSPYMKPLMDVYLKWIMDNPKASEDESLEKYNVLYDTMIDYDKITKVANEKWCKSEGGKILSDGLCTYDTAAGCASHYTMLNGKPEPIFTQWDPLNKKCVVNDWTIKKMCEENQLEYNPTNGLCYVTKELCLKKGADWDANKKDCVIREGQEVLEFIFGTTVTRGLKQVFDPKQYKSCPANTTDTGYVCNKNTTSPENCNTFGNKWYNEGLRCSNLLNYKVADCPKGYTNMGLTCEPQSLGRGVGLTWAATNKLSCPSSTPYHRGVWGAGWCDNGIRPDFWNMKTSKEKGVPKYVPYKNSLGVASKIANEPNTGWEKCGALYYPKCPTGMSRVGCNICRTNGPTKWDTSSMTCPNGYHKKGGLCYQKAAIRDSRGVYKYEDATTKPYKCATGVPYMGKCRATCPQGWTDDGLGCWKPRLIDYSTKENMVGNPRELSMLT